MMQPLQNEFVSFLLTNARRDAGQGGGGVGRAGELGLDAVRLHGVLAAAEVGARGRHAHLHAARHVVPPVRHALGNHREIRLTFRGVHS